tara:strand:+ start:351 stop:1145 length:795 start_codon:yes stop_codon:yes gene_type:complete
MTTTTTKLFFTGGWDSTFRLLELLVAEKRPVQPIYVIDPDRWSLREEQKAMADIKTTVVERFPEAANLLKPTMIIDKTDLKPDPAFKACELKLLETNIFGSQYEWLGRAAKQFGLEGAEVCVEYSEIKVAGCYVTINPLVEQIEDGSYYFAEEHKNTLEYEFFGMYSFPVMRTSKAEMMEKAEKYGFLDILEMSWFCHKPNFLGQACGMCNPCKDAMTMEMTHRVPPFGRFCYHLKRNLNPRTHLQHFPKVYDYLRTLKRKLKG